MPSIWQVIYFAKISTVGVVFTYVFPDCPMELIPQKIKTGTTRFEYPGGLVASARAPIFFPFGIRNRQPLPVTFNVEDTQEGDVICHAVTPYVAHNHVFSNHTLHECEKSVFQLEIGDCEKGFLCQRGIDPGIFCKLRWAV